MIVSLYRRMQESEPREHGCLDPESQFGLSPSSKLMGPRFKAIWRHSMTVGWMFDWLVYDAQKYSVMYWKRPWCWEWLKAGGEGDDRGWDGWRASLTQWTWVWGSSGSWWWTGKPGMLQSMGLQRVGHDWVTELNWQCDVEKCLLNQTDLRKFLHLPRTDFTPAKYSVIPASQSSQEKAVDLWAEVPGTW